MDKGRSWAVVQWSLRGLNWPYQELWKCTQINTKCSEFRQVAGLLCPRINGHCDLGQVSALQHRQSLKQTDWRLSPDSLSSSWRISPSFQRRIRVSHHSICYKHFSCLIGHLYLSLCEASVQVFCPFFNWVAQTFAVNLQALHKLSGYESLVKCIYIYTYSDYYFSQSAICPLIFLEMSFWWSPIFQFFLLWLVLFVSHWEMFFFFKLQRFSSVFFSRSCMVLVLF